MFGFQSSEIFCKKPEFPNFRNFREKVRKKVQKFKFGKKFGNYSKMYRMAQVNWGKVAPGRVRAGDTKLVR
jgi:hypothetical protein